MFSNEQFIADCRDALNESDSQAAVKELVARAVADPNGLIKAYGEPERAGFHTVYNDDDLTILQLVWGPEMNLFPHNHEMWAVIGIYGGREDNTFYRRDGDSLEKHGLKTLDAKDTVALGRDIIHSVRNPFLKLTTAIHVYGGDFFGVPRSEWDPETYVEKPYAVEHTKQAFEESNRRLDEIRGA